MKSLIKSPHCRACVASVMMMVYVARGVGENSDDSYNDFWMIQWVLAEVSIGVSITGTFSLPKFIEAEGPKLQAVFSRLTRPLVFGRRSAVSGQGKEDARIAPQEREPHDTFAMYEHSSESKLVASMNNDRDVERCASDEEAHDY